MSSENKKQGLLVIHTGNGKGKTTAAFGILFRALGRKMKCALVQFIKGKWKTGEGAYCRTIPEITYHVMGNGFTWESTDLSIDKAAAQKAWELSVQYILDDIHDIVILDEITYAINYDFISLDDVVSVLKRRPSQKHVVITGRNCPDALIEIAQTVTEMKDIKHAYNEGISIQKGIDF